MTALGTPAGRCSASLDAAIEACLLVDAAGASGPEWGVSGALAADRAEQARQAQAERDAGLVSWGGRRRWRGRPKGRGVGTGEGRGQGPGLAVWFSGPCRSPGFAL